MFDYPVKLFFSESNDPMALVLYAFHTHCVCVCVRKIVSHGFKWLLTDTRTDLDPFPEMLLHPSQFPLFCFPSKVLCLPV